MDPFRDREKVSLSLSLSLSPSLPFCLRLLFGEARATLVHFPARRDAAFSRGRAERDDRERVARQTERERERERERGARLGSCGSRVPLHVRTKLRGLAAASDRRRFAILHRDHVMAGANPRFRIPFRRRSSIFLSPSGEPSPGTGWVDLYGLPVRAFLSGFRFEIRQPKSRRSASQMSRARARAEFIRAGKSARRPGE